MQDSLMLKAKGVSISFGELAFRVAGVGETNKNEAELAYDAR